MLGEKARGLMTVEDIEHSRPPSEPHSLMERIGVARGLQEVIVVVTAYLVQSALARESVEKGEQGPPRGANPRKTEFLNVLDVAVQDQGRAPRKIVALESGGEELAVAPEVVVRRAVAHVEIADDDHTRRSIEGERGGGAHLSIEALEELLVGHSDKDDGSGEHCLLESIGGIEGKYKGCVSRIAGEKDVQVGHIELGDIWI